MRGTTRVVQNGHVSGEEQEATLPPPCGRGSGGSHRDASQSVIICTQCHAIREVRAGLATSRALIHGDNRMRSRQHGECTNFRTSSWRGVDGLTLWRLGFQSAYLKVYSALCLGPDAVGGAPGLNTTRGGVQERRSSCRGNASLGNKMLCCVAHRTVLSSCVFVP